MSYKVICALGDSITNGYWDEEGKGGWFGRLQQLILPAYPYQYGFNNLAMDGDRSMDALHRLQSEVSARYPDYLIIAIGCNDTIRWQSPDAAPETAWSMREETWDKLLSLAPKMVKRGVLVQCLLPMVEERYPNDGGEGRWLYHKLADLREYNAFLAKRCAAAGIPFADYWPVFDKLNWADYVYDGGHPNARGHQLVAELTFAKLKEIGWLA
jgi:lysophospholipase L1-like esterase